MAVKVPAISDPREQARRDAAHVLDLLRRARRAYAGGFLPREDGAMSEGKAELLAAEADVGKDRLLTAAQVAARLVLSVRTLWRMVAAGKFPQPVRYNRKLVRWKEADVSRYIKELEISGGNP